MNEGDAKVEMLALVYLYSRYDTDTYTYIPSPGDMFDIILGATSGGDMAEVQLFVDYLNLNTAQTQGQRLFQPYSMQSRLIQKL